MPDDAASEHEPNDDAEDEGDMPWESAARLAIASAVADVEFDEVRGAIYLMSGEDHRWNRVQEEFRGWESLQTRLVEIGENAWLDEAPFDEGEAVFSPNVDGYVEDFMVTHDVEGFFDRLGEPKDKDAEEILSADQLLAKGAGLVLQIDIAEINAELVRYLAKHPEKLRELPSRKFEELVAELFRDKGYDVTVTPRSKDGGLDIRVVTKSELGRFLILVECKRYAEDNKVGVEIIRGLYGVVSAENATSGLIATTSFFTKGAKSFQRKVESRMALADFEDLKKWLAVYKQRPNL